MHSPMNFYNNKEYLISLNNVDKKYGEYQILKDISIKVSRGEFISLIGPSGCGKSTIFNIITGLTSKDSGEVIVNGNIGYMQQKDLLLPWKNIMDNVSLPLILNGVEKKVAYDKVKRYLPIVGLEGYEDKYPSQLSGGMRQRASFLRTFMTSEEIMLLDESFGSLDSITKGKMQKWLLEMKEKLNNTILFITHDIEEALFLSDRIYVLSDKPASIKKEITLDFHKGDKLDRLLSPELLILKDEIIKLL